MESSIVLPLCFSYSVTALRSDISSSCTNPCENHMLAVVAAAFATWGNATVLAAARARDPRSIERLVRWAMTAPPYNVGRPEGLRSSTLALPELSSGATCEVNRSPKKSTGRLDVHHLDRLATECPATSELTSSGSCWPWRCSGPLDGGRLEPKNLTMADTSSVQNTVERARALRAKARRSRAD